MLSKEEVGQIQSETAGLLPKACALITGSYAYGEAAPESDLDILILTGLPDFFFYKKFVSALNRIKLAYQGAEIRFKFLPLFLFDYGWEYAEGVDIHGEWSVSPPQRKPFIRTALKLAWWHYLNYLASDNPARAINYLFKSAYRAAAALAMLNKSSHFPFFSKDNLASFLSSQGAGTDDLVLANLVRTRGLGMDFEPAKAATALKNLLDGTVLLARPYFGFSFSNYLIYNAKFLFGGSGLFLFKNPDKMILNEIISGLERGVDPKALIHKVRRYIYPVIVV